MKIGYFLKKSDFFFATEDIMRQNVIYLALKKCFTKVYYIG